MRGQAVVDGAKAYTVFFLRTLLFPLIWMWALATARRHQDTDPNAVRKVGGAIVVGIVLAVGVGGLLWTFENDARAGMYESLDGRLSVAVGESEYQDQVSAVAAADGQLEILNKNLADANAAAAEANATGDAEAEAQHRGNATVFEGSINDVLSARADALVRKAELEPNHALWGKVHAAVVDQNDARIKSLVSGADFEYEKMDSRTARALEIKDKADEDMMWSMNWILYPGVVGVFFAPLAIAMSSVLRTAWEPSDSVGFKPYPGKALGLFLLMGAFGVPALFFATWGFWDLDVRSKTGQISL